MTLPAPTPVCNNTDDTHILCDCWPPQGANASYAGTSGLMGPPGSAGSVKPVVEQKLQKMVQVWFCLVPSIFFSEGSFTFSLFIFFLLGA